MDNTLSQEMAIDYKTLHAATLNFRVPFTLCMDDDQVFVGTEILRVLPQKRMVAAGEWLGREVVAKIFFDGRNAKRHLEKELAGLKILQDNKIPTPVLYYQGHLDKRVHVLIFERLRHAENLRNFWRENRNKAEVKNILSAVMIELATQHVLGVIQTDLHLSNFLISPNKIYSLDGGQIEAQPLLLPKQQSMEHLALFLSQLGVGIGKLQSDLFRYYAKARGWILKPSDYLELNYHIKKINHLRWKKFQKKIFRDSTDFVHLKKWGVNGVVQRKYYKGQLQALLEDPESLFNQPNIEMLKAGRSATVAKIQINDKTIVVKRYNIKGPWHFLRRAFRATRARSSWRMAHKLQLFGVPTAEPIAFVDKSFCGLRLKSYYITEFIDGEDAGKYFVKHTVNSQNVVIIKSITELLKSIYQLNITHGDLKITNILLDKTLTPFLIDLDGAFEHFSMSSLRHSWRKEMKRFLENFQKDPLLKQQFHLELNAK